jgi:hypothetical protein
MNETDKLRKPFVIGLLATAIVFVSVGGFIAAVAIGHDDRPEGIAERWLTATSDLTRSGVRSDAEQRVRNDGDLALAEQLLTLGYDYKGKSAFTALEVGHGRRVDANTTTVPMKLTDRADDRQTKQAVLVLGREGNSWRVQALQPADATLRVPSDGGPPVSSAPLGLYAIALMIGAGITVAASALVRLAGREQNRASLDGNLMSLPGQRIRIVR